jgi:hypothetical protein
MSVLDQPFAGFYQALLQGGQQPVADPSRSSRIVARAVSLCELTAAVRDASTTVTFIVGGAEGYSQGQSPVRYRLSPLGFLMFQHFGYTLAGK